MRLPTRSRKPKLKQLPPGSNGSQEYHASEPRQLPATCGMWITVKMPTKTGPVEIPRSTYYPGRDDPDSMELRMTKAGSGMAAVQKRYQAELHDNDSVKAKANGRYVAIDFITGQRFEALITGDWKADLVVEDGSGNTGNDRDGGAA